MPPRRRTPKVRHDRLSPDELADLQRAGPVGVADGRRGRLWADDDDRRAVYEAHRDRVLAAFDAGGCPPRAAEDYEPPGAPFHEAAVWWWLARVAGTGREAAVAALLEAPDGRAARLAARPRVIDGMASR